MLTFSFIESIGDDVTREFMMTNFTEIFYNHASIPVNILVEPLLRAIQVNDSHYTPNVFDFEFFSTIAKH